MTHHFFNRPLSLITAATLYLLSFGVTLSSQNFSKATVFSDLDYLTQSLEDTHFNLYAYTSKPEFLAYAEELKASVTSDSLSLLETTVLFQKVVAKAKNAHTRIAFSSQYLPYIQYFQNGGTVFPLEIALEDNKAYVRRNWSSNSQIAIGDELLAINNILINQVLEAIYPLISAERPYFAKALLESTTLPRYYWMVFGEQATFNISVVQQGKTRDYTLDAIKAFDDYEKKRIELLQSQGHLNYPSANTAYILPGEFGGDLKAYQKFIDSSFTDIKLKQSKHLIIDLRNHPGGDDPFGDYLVSYIADKPFVWSKFQLKSSQLLKSHVLKTSDTTKAYAQSILSHKNGTVFSYNFPAFSPQPEGKRFKGEVYVLVNRLSYSQSTVTAAQIQDYGWGTIVGEETAEYPNLYASLFNYTLPKTGITVKVSKGKMTRLSGIDHQKGLIPDIIIKDHLLDETDEILNTLLERLEEY